MSLTVQAVSHLDSVPVPLQLAEDLDLKWSVRLENRSARTRLYGLQEDLVLVDGRSGLLEVSGAAPVDQTLRPWRRWSLDLEDIFPSYRSDPVLLNRSGEVLRWAPGREPRRVWTAPLSDRITVTGLEREQLLITRYAAPAATSLVDTRTNNTLWEVIAALPRPLVHEDIAIITPVDSPESLVCIELESGATRWTRQVPQLATLAIVNSQLWVAVDGGKLTSLDTRTGKQRANIAVQDNARPQGPVDANGHLHLCTGLNYQVFDLWSGERLYFNPFETGSAPRGLLYGSNLLPISDGRVIFADDRGRLEQLVDPMAQPELVFQGDAPIMSMGVVQQRLITLDDKGELRCF